MKSRWIGGRPASIKSNEVGVDLKAPRIHCAEIEVYMGE